MPDGTEPAQKVEQVDEKKVDRLTALERRMDALESAFKNWIESGGEEK